MEIGVVYPQIELGGDPHAVRLIGQAVETFGYDYLLMFDRVADAVRENRTRPLFGPYSDQDPFHDPLVSFGFLAGITERIGFATGILVLPQRQTLLVARQSAHVDLYSGGRLRLGVAAGWNYVEYDALGQDFGARKTLGRAERTPSAAMERRCPEVQRAVRPRGQCCAQSFSKAHDPDLVWWWPRSKQVDAERGVAWPEVPPSHATKAGTSWQIFPNFQIGHAVNNMLCYQARPYGFDPNKSVFEAAVYELYPEGRAPETEWEYTERGNWPPVLEQDFTNMAAVQQGMKNKGFRGTEPNPYRERAVASLHYNLARFMGTGAPHRLK